MLSPVTILSSMALSPSVTELMSISPCGKLFVSDGLTETLGGPPGEWAVLVADVRGNEYEILHRFAGTGGAKSWRVSHPHPVFSTDSRRIYYNVNAGQYTQLYVAELARS